jgi:hypothetical protein
LDERLMAKSGAQRERDRRKRKKRQEACFELTLPERLPAAALIAAGEEGNLLDPDVVCEKLSRLVTKHLVEIVRGATDMPLRPIEIRRIEDRLNS